MVCPQSFDSVMYHAKNLHPEHEMSTNEAVFLKHMGYEFLETIQELGGLYRWVSISKLAERILQKRPLIKFHEQTMTVPIIIILLTKTNFRQRLENYAVRFQTSGQSCTLHSQLV